MRSGRRDHVDDDRFSIDGFHIVADSSAARDEGAAHPAFVRRSVRARTVACMASERRTALVLPSLGCTLVSLYVSSGRALGGPTQPSVNVAQYPPPSYGHASVEKHLYGPIHLRAAPVTVKFESGNDSIWQRACRIAGRRTHVANRPHRGPRIVGGLRLRQALARSRSTS